MKKCSDTCFVETKTIDGVGRTAESKVILRFELSMSVGKGVTVYLFSLVGKGVPTTPFYTNSIIHRPVRRL